MVGAGEGDTGVVITSNPAYDDFTGVLVDARRMPFRWRASIAW